MPSLKDLKNRIKSVKNTQKITKAMKMVAAAKLRRAKDRAEAARPYAENMEKILMSLAAGNQQTSGNIYLCGTGKSETHLLVVLTSDRGLCGAFNSSIVRAARKKIESLKAEGKKVKIFCVGKKGYEQLRLVYEGQMIGRLSDIGRKQVSYAEAQTVFSTISALLEKENIDVVHIVYNHFKSAISQIVTFQQILPLDIASAPAATSNYTYEYEPSEEGILADLLPRNVAVQLYKALLENAASEQGSRMSAMDNATRNAGDMIKKLNLRYNRTRQAAITKELIEIISGAEAL